MVRSLEATQEVNEEFEEEEEGNAGDTEGEGPGEPPEEDDTVADAPNDPCRLACGCAMAMPADCRRCSVSEEAEEGVNGDAPEDGAEPGAAVAPAAGEAACEGLIPTLSCVESSNPMNS